MSQQIGSFVQRAGSGHGTEATRCLRSLLRKARLVGLAAVVLALAVEGRGQHIENPLRPASFEEPANLRRSESTEAPRQLVEPEARQARTTSENADTPASVPPNVARQTKSQSKSESKNTPRSQPTKSVGTAQAAPARSAPGGSHARSYGFPNSPGRGESALSQRKPAASFAAGDVSVLTPRRAMRDPRMARSNRHQRDPEEAEDKDMEDNAAPEDVSPSPPKASGASPVPPSHGRPAGSGLADPWPGNSMPGGGIHRDPIDHDPSDPESMPALGAEGEIWEHAGASEMLGCDACGSAGCSQCCIIPCPSLDNAEFMSGVQGFTGPANRGQQGSFGFHEGVNYGAPLPLGGGALGVQVGARVAHSNYSGSSFTEDSRHQVFVTAGLFRRVDFGWQGGAVVDYLHDDWYFNNDLTQLRGELSWVGSCQNEFGFWFAVKMNERTETTSIRGADLRPTQVSDRWQATDLYAFFFRRPLVCGATGRVFGGFTGDSDALFGSDVFLPLADQLALASSFTYLVPKESASAGGVSHEAWNIGVSLVWYPGCRGSRTRDYYRPLLNVADNGSFIVNRR